MSDEKDQVSNDNNKNGDFNKEFLVEDKKILNEFDSTIIC